MRNAFTILGLMFVMAICFQMSSCKEADDPPDDIPTLEGIFSHEDTIIFNGINQYRLSLNLPELKASKTIWVVANIQSLGMAKGEKPLSHDGFETRAQQVRKVMGTTGAGTVGENLALITPNILKSLVEIWSESPEHKKNIIGDYTYCAVSTVPDNSGKYYYITALFYK